MNTDIIILCNCIEVRYVRKGRRMLLKSYAVYGDHACFVSHQTTEHNRKAHDLDLEPLLKIEQSRHPEFPIHVL